MKSRTSAKGWTERGSASVMAAACLLAAGGAARVASADLILSVRDNQGVQLGGLSLLDGDIAGYDLDSGVASMILPESAFTSGSIDVNAVHMRKNGNIVFSTLFNGSIGGIVFGDGDVVEYNPLLDVATILLPESAWTGSTTVTDVNGVFIRADGTMLLSHVNDLDAIGGLAFSNGDIAVYDPGSDTASLLVAESVLFDDMTGNIDALHELADGRLVLSFQDDETISGIAFADGDMVAYDPRTDTAELFLSEEIFDSPMLANDVNAFSMTPVPVPGAVSLMVVGAFVASPRRRRTGVSVRLGSRGAERRGGEMRGEVSALR